MKTFLSIFAFYCTAALSQNAVTFSDSRFDDGSNAFRQAILVTMSEVQDGLQDYQFSNFLVHSDLKNNKFEIDPRYSWYSNQEATLFVGKLMEALNKKIQTSHDFQSLFIDHKSRRDTVNLYGNCADEVCMANFHFPKTFVAPVGLEFLNLAQDSHDLFRVEFLKRMVFLKSVFDENPKVRFGAWNMYDFNTAIQFKGEGRMRVGGGSYSGNGSQYLPMYSAFWNRELANNAALRLMALNFESRDPLHGSQPFFGGTTSLDYRNLSHNIVPLNFDGVGVNGGWTIAPEYRNVRLAKIVCDITGSDYASVEFTFRPQVVDLNIRFTNGERIGSTGWYGLTWDNSILQFRADKGGNGLQFFSIDFLPGDQFATGNYRMRHYNSNVVKNHAMNCSIF